MSFKRYPKYKDSGVEWLGEVPDLWSVVPLMRLTPDDRQIMYGIVLPGPHVEDGVPIVKGGDIVAERLNPLTLNRTTREIEAGFVRSRLRGGDIVYAIRGSIGEAAIVPPTLTGANITQDAARIAPKLGVDARWLLFAMQSQPVFTQLEQTVNGAAIRGINIWQLKRARIPLPSLSEQSSIAAFLDRETAKIDGLVAEQRRLIELLKEKRQAVISHAVTKGLNPDAPMKPSGIEWLGDVPEHWTLPPLYVRYEQVLGKMLDHGKLTGRHPTPYLRNADVRWDHVNVDDLPVMDIAPHERDRFTVRNGDLLMVEGRELGRCAIWQGDDGVIGFQKALHRLRRLDESEDARFFYYLMIFVNGTGAFVANQSPNEIPHLTGEELRRYRFPKPPYDEQVEIAEFLDSAARQFDALAAQSEHAIDLLQERRAALISAAVTGKIDIRDRAGVRPPAQRPYTSGFAIQLLAAEVLTQCHAEPTTGR